MTREYEMEHETKSGLFLTVRFSADFEPEDHGIGGYEYWGAKGNDVYWVNVCQEVEGLVALNEDGVDVFDNLTEEEQDSIEAAAEEYANDNAPEVE